MQTNALTVAIPFVFFAEKFFVIEVNAKRYVDTLLPKLIEECKSLLPSGFILQQDGAPAHTEKLPQDWISTNCSELIGTLNSPDFNPFDYRVYGVRFTTRHFIPS